jgi:Tfp pilus assembly protein PilF
MRKRLLALGALLLACGHTPPRPAAHEPPAAVVQGRPKSPAEQLSLARERLRASEYTAAEDALRQALSGPSHAEAELVLSEVFLATGRYSEAVSSAASASRRDPALARRAATIGAEALRRSGHVADAEARLLPFERDPEARPARLALAEIRIETGRRNQAEPVLLGLVEDYNQDRITDEDGEGLALAARAAWLLRSPRDANTLFNAAERAEASDPRLLLWRAELFLDKYDPGHAEEVLGELLRNAPHHPEALTLLAHVRLDQALDFDEAERLANLALKQNPALASAHFVLAGIALRDMELERADNRIDEGLAKNPRNLELLALRATVRFLADDAAGFERAKRAVLSLNPEYAKLYAILGEYADWEHRYDEIVVLMREALAIDSEDAGALAQLGLNLIRAGDESQGVSTLSRSFALDPYNVRVYNTLNLFDTVIPKAYVTVRTPRFSIRYHKDDKAVLERYVPKLLDQAYAAMQQGYGFSPETPVGIEIYAERESFAVRTSGLPRTAIQGVCFGKTLASMSPQNESFNLGMTLWHELSHVFHIQLSKSRVPRWFTEGLAEWETLVTRTEWAREHDPELYDMVRAGKLPALANMSRAFTRAEELSDVATAYYASSRIVEMLAGRYGRGKMAEMLRLWGSGLPTAQVVERGLGTTLADVDREFRAELDKSLARYGQQFVPLKRARARAALEDLLRVRPTDVNLKTELALALIRSGKGKAGAQLLDEALKSDPRQAQARFLRAQIHAEAGDKQSAETLLRAMLKDGQDGYSVDLELAELARARGDSASARAALELAHQRDPTQVEPLLGLAEIARAEDVPSEELLILEKLARLSEHSPAVHRRLLERLLAEKRYADAVRAGEAALWADINGLSTHVLFAEALENTGDLARARFELESAILCPGDPPERADAHARLAALLVRLKQPAQAKKQLREALKLDPGNERANQIKI